MPLSPMSSELHAGDLLIRLHHFVAHLQHELERKSAFSTAIMASCTSAPLPSTRLLTL